MSKEVGKMNKYEKVCLIRLEMRKWKIFRIEEILASNSRLVSALSEASRARFSLAKVSQKVRTIPTNNDHWVTVTVLSGTVRFGSA